MRRDFFFSFITGDIKIYPLEQPRRRIEISPKTRNDVICDLCRMCDVLFLRGLKPEFFLICEEFYEKKPPTIVENVTLSSFIIIKKKKIILYQPVSPSLKNNEIQTEENSS